MARQGRREKINNSYQIQEITGDIVVCKKRLAERNYDIKLLTMSTHTKLAVLRTTTEIKATVMMYSLSQSFHSINIRSANKKLAKRITCSGCRD